MDENIMMESTVETMEPEVMDDTVDYDVVEVTSDNHSMAKTAVKALVGLGVTVGAAVGIKKCRDKRRESKYHEVPRGRLMCR